MLLLDYGAYCASATVRSMLQIKDVGKALDNILFEEHQH